MRCGDCNGEGLKNQHEVCARCQGKGHDGTPEPVVAKVATKTKEVAKKKR